MRAYDDYKIKLTTSVSWGDLDAMRHVNNAVFLQYFEDARIAYYDAIGLGHCANEIPLLGVVKSIRCDYIQPVHFPDVLQVGARTIEVSDEGFTLEMYVHSETKGLCALGETEIAILDSLTHKKVGLSFEIKNAIQKLETT